MKKVYCGIDISKNSFDVAILVENKIKSKVYSNNNAGIKNFFTYISQHELQDCHFCMEATGIYGHKLANFLHGKGALVSVVNPARIKGFAATELARNKTDKADAKLIAKFCKLIEPVGWSPEPKHIQELQSLVRRLDDLLSVKNQEENRLEAASEIVKKDIEKMITFVDEQIKALRKKIKQHINNHPDLAEKQDLLNSIPGVGEATIAVVLAFLGDAGKFKNARQMAAFVGLNPKQRQSGSSIRGRSSLSKMGDSKLRKSLFLPAMVAKKYNPIIKAFCENLAKNGKEKMVILGAAMRKLIHIIFGVLKHNQPFNGALH